MKEFVKIMATLAEAKNENDIKVVEKMLYDAFNAEPKQKITTEQHEIAYKIINRFYTN